MKLNNETLTLMEEVTQAIGVAGDERHVSRILARYYKQYTNEIIYDKLGSIYAVRRCGKKNAPKIMICAHLDEVGFIVKGFTENGLIKFLPLGGFWNQNLLSQRIRLLNREGKEFYGTILSKAPHEMKEEEKLKTLSFDDMYIDIGCRSQEEIDCLNIIPGDSIVLDGSFHTLQNGGRLLSKAWDNRYGCILGIELLKALEDVDVACDLYIGANVQEEIGLRGAQTAVSLIEPDMAIVLDCAYATDIDAQKEANGRLGEGVLATFYDKGMLPNKTLFQFFIDICKDKNIPYQYAYAMGNTDAKWIHKYKTGCPTLSVCICARNIHTSSSIIDTNDFLSAHQALLEVVRRCNRDYISKFILDNR